MQELFETRNGRVIMDEDLSSKMYLIKQYHPEKADETSSGFEWSEMGMANLLVCSTLTKLATARNTRAGTPITKEHGVRTREQFSCPRRLKISSV